MILKDFNNVIMEQMDQCKAMLMTKGHEYAPEVKCNANVDRLAHFKKAAVLMNTTPKAALIGMLSKHLISISDMGTDAKDYPVEQWDEKITDSINYLLILRAMVEEEQHEQD